MSSASLRLVRWTESRLPRLAAGLAAPRVRGASSIRHQAGTLFRPAVSAPRSLVVCFAAHPPSASWLAASVAVRLGALVLVPDANGDRAALPGHTAGLLETAGLDAGLTAVIGEGAAAADAVAACRALGAARIALLYPDPIPEALITRGNVPTTLLQSSLLSVHRASHLGLDTALRAAGVAVRETEYAKVADDWARFPRAVAGSRRALDDLIAFLERGIGQRSTFDVIPGWDLH